ncbi:MAG TPA: hypothetical protein VG755_02825 [Nannocystaceae bacterium]|nr:hypothetical protein [Nannocystaceae bacterium]
MTDVDTKYSFEDEPHAGSVRARRQALDDLDKLLLRLAVSSTDANVLRGSPLMVRWAMDVPGNIAWYERAKQAARARQWLVLLGVILFATVAMVGAAMPAVLEDSDSDAPVAVAQVAIFVALAWGVLQVVASLADQKAKLAGFAKASADLKEALYTFEETWRGRALVKDGAADPDFATAVLQEVANARKTARAERDAYFADIPSTTDVAKQIGDALDQVGRSAAALGDARKARSEPKETTRMTADTTVSFERQRWIDAKAATVARRTKLERLTAANAPADAIATAKSELLDAEIAEVEARERFTMIVKGDMLNPS